MKKFKYKKSIYFFTGQNKVDLIKLELLNYVYNYIEELMAEKSDYMKVASAQMLRISPKQERQKQEYEQNNKKKRFNDQDLNEDELSLYFDDHLNHLNEHQLIELGRLILNKRNTEMKLYIRIIKKKHQGSDDEFYKLLDTDILLIKSKLAEIEKNISDFDFYAQDQSQSIQEENEILESLGHLKKLYNQFLHSAINEQNILLEKELDDLDVILLEKEEILKNIELYQKSINYNIFKNYPPDYPNKAKANEILSDIHNVMNEIVKIEDENSVELQTSMNELKQEIQSRSKETQAISKYSSGNIKSHFIDTTK